MKMALFFLRYDGLMHRRPTYKDWRSAESNARRKGRKLTRIILTLLWSHQANRKRPQITSDACALDVYVMTRTLQFARACG